MEEVIIKKSIKQRLVYDFFYPGILGSILYDILPLQNNVSFFIKLSIVLLFSLDYYHLYFFMDDKFKQKEKDTFIYVFFDFLVAVLIFIAFKYCGTNALIVILSIALIPVCFFVYSLQLKFNRLFYGLFSLGSLLLVYFVNTRLNNDETNNNYWTIYFILAITITYLAYVTLKINEAKRK